MYDLRFSKYTLIRIYHFKEKTPYTGILCSFASKFYPKKGFFSENNPKAELNLKWESEKGPFFLKTGMF